MLTFVYTAEGLLKILPVRQKKRSHQKMDPVVRSVVVPRIATRAANLNLSSSVGTADLQVGV